MFVYILRQNEPVGSRRQDASGNLNRLVKGDFGGLIRFICSCNGQDNQKCNQKRNGGNLLHDSSFLLYCGRMLHWFFPYYFFFAPSIWPSQMRRSKAARECQLFVKDLSENVRQLSFQSNQLQGS